jgi:hypothetical protein
MSLHRIQIDIDVEAESHEEAVWKVVKWWCGHRNGTVPDTKDSLVLEENEEVCPTCNPKLLESGYTLYQEYNNKPESQ